MFRYLLPLLFLLTILLPLFIVVSYGEDHGVCLDRDLLRRFLEDQYVEEVGLLRAATTVYPDNVTCYIANDNVLASRALTVLGSPLGLRIVKRLDSEFGGGWNNKIDILLGRDIPDTFYASYIVFIGEVDGYRIAYEKINYSQPIYDWYRYADLLVYYALKKLLHGRVDEAEQAFINLTRMWDGYGFRDRVYNETGMYSVYKCALFIYLFRSLDAAGSEIVHSYRDIYDRCLEIICKAQNPTRGGIHTEYMVSNGEIVIVGDMNTETTSIVVLALYSNYPKTIATKTKQSTPLLGIEIYIAILLTIIPLSIILYKLIHKPPTSIQKFP